MRVETDARAMVRDEDGENVRRGGRTASSYTVRPCLPSPSVSGPYLARAGA